MGLAFLFFQFWKKMDFEQNELESVFEDEVSEDSSSDSVFSSKLNSPFKNLDLEDNDNNNNNNNNNNIIIETSSIYFSSDDSFKKIKRKRITMDHINEKLRKYSNMKNILLQND
jgi:hypothetical protein